MSRLSDMIKEQAGEVISRCYSDPKEIYRQYPDAFQELCEQYEHDKKTYGKLPTYIVLNVDGSYFNTTILYRSFLPVYQMVQQNPSLLTTPLASNLGKSEPERPLSRNGVPANQIWGDVPVPKQ